MGKNLKFVNLGGKSKGIKQIKKKNSWTKTAVWLLPEGKGADGNEGG